MALADMIGTLPSAGTGPLYLQFQRLLREAIRAGRLESESALPSERDLCEEFGLSRVTIRRALADLVSEGHLVRRQGAGTFVGSFPPGAKRLHVEKNFAVLSSFSEDMISRGVTPTSEWLTRSRGLVTPQEALSLALSPGSPVYRFHRLRLADGRPMAVEYSTIAGYCLPQPEAVDDSLYAALDKHGHRPVRALQRLRAMAFPAEQADRLQVDTGHAGLLIERRSFLADGRVVELTLSYYRGDAYDFVAELSER